MNEWKFAAVNEWLATQYEDWPDVWAMRGTVRKIIFTIHLKCEC